MKWLKWHLGSVNDPKFTVVARKAKQPKAVVLAVWAALLEIGAADEGKLESLDFEDVAAGLDIEPEHVTAVYAAMCEKEMIQSDAIANWRVRQDYDKSTERVRRFRSKEQPDETHETVSNVSETQETPETVEESRGEEIREDKKKDLPPIAPQTDRTDARGTRLSADWQPDEHLQAFAHGLGLDVGRVAEDFRDYWHGKAGSAARKADWAATWRKWCRRTADDVQRPSPARTGPRGGIGSNMLEAGALAAQRLRDDQARRSGCLGGFEGGNEAAESRTIVGTDNRFPLALVRG